MSIAYSESVVNFRCEGESLLGIFTSPITPQTSSDIGVVIVVGGPQYRVGSHRQFVQLARGLASVGYGVLRFDYRGMGDSDGKQRDFESIDADIEAAIDCLLAQGNGLYKQVVLWGLCDAASAALLYWQSKRDSRLTGMVLLNPWIRSAESLARAQVKNYYLQRLMAPEFWNKLLRGKVAKDALNGLARTALKALQPIASDATTSVGLSFQQRMAEALTDFSGQLLLILCERDLVAQEFVEFCAASSLDDSLSKNPRSKQYRSALADHTFSNIAEKQKSLNAVITWLKNSPFTGATHIRAGK